MAVGTGWVALWHPWSLCSQRHLIKQNQGDLPKLTLINSSLWAVGLFVKPEHSPRDKPTVTFWSPALSYRPSLTTAETKAARPAPSICPGLRRYPACP